MANNSTVKSFLVSYNSSTFGFLNIVEEDLEDLTASNLHAAAAAQQLVFEEYERSSKSKDFSGLLRLGKKAQQSDGNKPF